MYTRRTRVLAQEVSLSLKSWHLSVLSSIFDKFVGLDDSFFFIEVLNSKNLKVYWERKGKVDVTGANQLQAFDGIPYVHIGEKILWCHQGQDKRKKKDPQDTKSYVRISPFCGIFL